MVDVGCGTGTLAIALAARGAEVVAVDGDPEVLALARAKPGADAVQWREGTATALALPASSADRVVMSLLLHHLGADAKRAALAEAVRVLRPGGRLHVADWGRPRDPLMRGAAWVLQRLDGADGLAEHLDGRLHGLLADAGLAAVAVRDRLRTGWGSLELLSALAGLIVTASSSASPPAMTECTTHGVRRSSRATGRSCTSPCGGTALRQRRGRAIRCCICRREARLEGEGERRRAVVAQVREALLGLLTVGSWPAGTHHSTM